MVMNPTDEQAAILDAAGRVVRVNARAGTGKTTTLRMLAEKHRDRKLLYLVFNRRAMEEAERTFPANITVRTLHSLAFRHGGYEWKDHIGSFSPADLLGAFREEQQTLAALTHGFLVFFMNAAFGRLEDATAAYEAFIPADRIGFFRDHRRRIIAVAREAATAWNRKESPCPHDFYLKMAHSRGAFDSELARYDMVLVDEGQDLSPIMLDVLGRCRRRVVMVGDTHQQIYGFRYAINAMDRLPVDEAFDLTRSFRFGKSIAVLASLLIREAKDDARFRVAGNPEKSSRLGFFSTSPKRPGSGTAILSRTNFSLFANAVDLRARGIPYVFERDIGPVLWRALDVYRLSENRRGEIRDRFVKSFESVDRLKAYAEEMDDYPLLATHQIVKRYADQFPGIIFEMGERCRERSPEAGGITLSTVHSAKGRQYPIVYIDKDVADCVDRAAGDGGNAEEINLAYVGLTRAEERLFLAAAFKSLLTPRWKELMKKIEAAQRGQRSRGGVKSSPATRPENQGAGGVKFSEKLPKPAAINPPSAPGCEVGDRVSTALGRGTIITIKGDECLVDLDNQPGCAWWRIRELD